MLLGQGGVFVLRGHLAPKGGELSITQQKLGIDELARTAQQQL